MINLEGRTKSTAHAAGLLPDISGVVLGSAIDDIKADPTHALLVSMWWRVPLAAVAGVHGYKRNGGSTGSAITWGALGFVFPVITNVVALFQGYGKEK